MAAQQFTLNYAPSLGGEEKKDVVISTPLVDPTANQIWVGFGDTVATRRGNEIVEGLRWLISGIRDLKLIEETTPLFRGSALVVAANIDTLTESDRRISSSLAGSTVADPDLVVAMGDVTTALGYKTMHETDYEQLIRAVQEWLHKNG